MIIQSKDDLVAIQQEFKDRNERRKGNKAKSQTIEIMIGMATCGIAAGSQKVMDAFAREISERNLKHVKIIPVGCMGYCHSEPTVVITMAKKNPVIYGKVDPDVAIQILDQHILNHKVVKSHVLESEFERVI